MYKYILLAVATVLTLRTNAQEFPKNDAGKIEYSEVVNVEGATKEQLFRTSRAWFVEHFGKQAMGEDIIQIDDSYLGEMAAMPLLWIEVKSLGKKLGAGAVSYTIIVSSKDGKYKYTVNNLYHEANRSTVGSGGAIENETPDCGEETMSLAIWNEIKVETKVRLEALIAEMKERMQAAATNTEGDW